MRYHIVNLSLVYQGDPPMPEQDHAGRAFRGVFQDLQQKAHLLSGGQHGPASFLVSHDALLRWLASSTTHYKEIQIQIFSLQGPEGQLVSQDGSQDWSKPETYQIAR